jgi:hypothetical protein
MAKLDFSKLPPALQKALFAAAQQQGAQPTSGGLPMSTPDAQAQQGVGDIQAPPSAPLQQLPGDKMHPADAIQQIAQQAAPAPTQPASYSPTIVAGGGGSLYKQVPRESSVGKLLFGSTYKERLNDPTNYYATIKQIGATNLLPANLPTLPDGTPYVNEQTFKTIAASKQLPSGNNPTLDKKTAVALGVVTKDQADQLFPDDTSTKPLNELRLGVLATMANTRKGALSLANNKFEADQIKELVNSISDAKATNATPLGQQANRLDAIIHGRQILQGAYNPDTKEYGVPSAMYKELVMNLARSVSPTGQLSEQTQKELESPSLYGNLSKAFQFITGTPVTGSTQDIIKMYRDQLDRQGAVSQDLFNAHAARELPKGIVLQKTNPLAYAATMQQSFGTHDYRAFVGSGPDGEISKIPAQMNLGGRGGQVPPVDPPPDPVQAAPAPAASVPAPQQAAPVPAAAHPGIGVPHPRIRIKAVREMH